MQVKLWAPSLAGQEKTHVKEQRKQETAHSCQLTHWALLTIILHDVDVSLQVRVAAAPCISLAYLSKRTVAIPVPHSESRNSQPSQPTLVNCHTAESADTHSSLFTQHPPLAIPCPSDNLHMPTHHTLTP